MGSIAEPTQQQKIQSKDSNPTQISPFCIDLHSGMAEWDSLPTDILLLIAAYFDFFEDFFNFCLVCKPWQSVSLICGKSRRTLPPRCPWVMLPDIAEMNFPKVTREMIFHKMLAEEVEKNERIEGMDKRRFFRFSTSKIYEFELPEATRKKCYGVSNGWLMTIGYDLEINLLHPFSRLQVGMPPFMSFQDQYKYKIIKPQTAVSMYVRKAVMSSNPYNNSSNEDCIVVAIYGQFKLLAFARPGDKVWTDIYPRIKCYLDVVYFKGKFYAIDVRGVIVVCDFDDVKRPTATPIAHIPVGRFGNNSMYLVESSGSLLVVVRFRKGPNYKLTVKRTTYVDGKEDEIVIITKYIDGTEEDDVYETDDDVDDETEDETDDDVDDETEDETDDDVDDETEDETDDDVDDETEDETDDDVDDETEDDDVNDETEDDDINEETEDDDVIEETEDDDDNEDTEDDEQVVHYTNDETEDDEQRLHYTVRFSIFKLEECNGERRIIEAAYPYRLGNDLDYKEGDDEQVPSSYAYHYELIPVKNLGDKSSSLFLGFNASASLPCSSNNNVKANHIYFSDDEPITYGNQPFGGGPDTGMYDVESGKITFHDASKFTSHLTPSMWYI